MADHYHIRVKGYLDPLWSEWLDELTIVHEVDGDTALDGALADQAALFGVLMKIRDLGLSLMEVSVQPASGRVDP
jgi:hypothetical protein